MRNFDEADAVSYLKGTSVPSSESYYEQLLENRRDSEDNNDEDEDENGEEGD
jgi:hypothetical protein